MYMCWKRDSKLLQLRKPWISFNKVSCTYSQGPIHLTRIGWEIFTSTSRISDNISRIWGKYQLFYIVLSVPAKWYIRQHIIRSRNILNSACSLLEGAYHGNNVHDEHDCFYFPYPKANVHHQGHSIRLT